jgi:hypothetical protein
MTSTPEAVFRVVDFWFSRGRRKFRGYDLVRNVKLAFPELKNKYEDTFMKALRRLREQGKVNYEIVGDKGKSLYELIEVA